MSSEQYTNEHLKQLKSVQQQIINGIQLLNTLSDKYKVKTQKSFLNTFLHVMDKMSNELIQAQENYRNVDRQIQTDKKCVTLAKEVNFFKHQCIELKKQLQVVKSQLCRQKNKNFQLNRQNTQLNCVLEKKIKQIERYKALSLSKHKQKMSIKFNQPLWKSIDLQQQTQQKSNKKRYQTIKLKNIVDKSNEKVKIRILQKQEQVRPSTKMASRFQFTRNQTPLNSSSFRTSRRQTKFSELL